jgi:hypothetical protein
MLFAIAMTLVVLVSGSLLLYQYFAGSLTERPSAEAPEPGQIIRPEAPTFPARPARAA